MSPEWVTAIVAVIALVGGGIWAGVTYFASKDYADALERNLKELKKDFDELREILTSHMANEAYYRQHIEDQRVAIQANKNVMENVDGLFRDIDAKLKNGKLKVI